MMFDRILAVLALVTFLLWGVLMAASVWVFWIPLVKGDVRFVP